MSARYGGVRRGAPGGYGRPKTGEPLPRFMRRRTGRLARVFVLLLALAMAAAPVLVVAKVTPAGFDLEAAARVLCEVLEERQSQHARWGEQDHPDGTGPLLRDPCGGWYLTNGALADSARLHCHRRAAVGGVTWADIFREETREALAEADPARLRVELLQVAAVAAAWVEAIDRRHPDLVIAHPPCTYLANSGVQWLHRDPARWAAMEDGAAFFRLMFEFTAPRIAVENPIQHRYALTAHGMGKPTQIVQPWQHGHTQSKATGLWLRGLPPLLPTVDVRAAMLALPARDRMPCWWTGSRTDRWKIRSRTYEGIAQAMAEQWGSL